MDLFEDAVEDQDVEISEEEEEKRRSPKTPKSPIGEELPPRPFNLEETIPPTNEHRTLILCFDGTGDQFDDDVSTWSYPILSMSSCLPSGSVM